MKNISFLPKAYFVVSGKAVSNISPLNAFDRALIDAGIAQYNLVAVSSIIPVDAEEIESYKFKPGTIVFVVLARMDGNSGEEIGAGIGITKSDSYGLVAEAHGFKNENELENELRSKLLEMAEAREMENGPIKTKIESMVVPKNYEYGCVIAVLIYVL